MHPKRAPSENPNHREDLQGARNLTPRQRKRLRALAHHLKPCVQIGVQGVTENLAKQLSEALEHHELIKVHLGKNSQTTQAADKRDLQEKLAAVLDARSHIVCRVGGVVTLYREIDPARARLPLAHLGTSAETFS